MWHKLRTPQNTFAPTTSFVFVEPILTYDLKYNYSLELGRNRFCIVWKLPLRWVQYETNICALGDNLYMFFIAARRLCGCALWNLSVFDGCVYVCVIVRWAPIDEESINWKSHNCLAHRVRNDRKCLSGAGPHCGRLLYCGFGAVGALAPWFT